MGAFARRRPISTNTALRIGLRGRFPKLAAAVGDDTFTAIVRAYEAREPWQLPGFLASHPKGTCSPCGSLASLAYPLWYAELATLERARAELEVAPAKRAMTRAELIHARDIAGLRIQLVPAHALVSLTTNVDEVWAALEADIRPPLPIELDWPRTILLWRVGREIHTRTADPDEATALAAAARGVTVGDLADEFIGGNPFARAIDVVLTWIDGGVV